MVMLFRIATTFTLLLAATSPYAQGVEDSVLAQCSAQSQDLDLIHGCLDNYLDISDANIASITNSLESSLSGESLSGLQSSQQAFEEYRRQNCLWYLNFSSPRGEAEQIAKQCLVDMSNQRLEELRTLVSLQSATVPTVQGFYVYGAERNSFQPCGSEQRYWVEGVPDAVGLIQQTYLSTVTGERQVLHATVVGNTVNAEQAPPGHSGVFEISQLIGLRLPTDADCQLPNFQQLPNDVNNAPSLAVQEIAPIEDNNVDDEEPEQQLTAFFGSWVADCIELTGQKSCSLYVALTSPEVSEPVNPDAGFPKLTLDRNPGQGTTMALFFPEREIDSPSLIRWSVDDEAFGDVYGSEIRVDQLGAQQLVAESRFLSGRLLPAMVEGLQLDIDVLSSVDETQGERFSGTLVGLTKALSFADGFINE